jgi:hypothetical protein
MRNCPMSNSHHNRAVFTDPIAENETVLKLSRASWMWISGRKRMGRNARKRHREEQIVCALRQVQGGKKVSETWRKMGVSQEAVSAASQVQIHLELVIRIGRDHESPPSQAQQIVFPHHPQNPLVIHLHPSSAQLCTDPSIAIASAMFQGNLLNRRPYLRFFLGWSPLLQRSIEARSTHSYQLTHALDRHAALQ